MSAQGFLESDMETFLRTKASGYPGYLQNHSGEVRYSVVVTGDTVEFSQFGECRSSPVADFVEWMLPDVALKPWRPNRFGAQR